MDVIAIRITDGVVTLRANLWLAALVAAIAIAILLRSNRKRERPSEFEIDEAELGLGNQKVKLRRNQEDLRVAYRIWVELSTRKVGLPINFEHDLIAGIYASWHQFFGVTRELV